MEKYIKGDNNTGNDEEEVESVSQTPEIENAQGTESLDLKGGRIIHIPDFVELASMGYSEETLKKLLRLRLRFQQGDHESTPETIRLRFGRYLYEKGKISA